MSTASRRGFTLAELAIVMIIIGVLLVPLFQFYEIYLRNQAIQTTEDNINTINTQISNYYSLTGHYPCPADRTLPSSDPDYGKGIDLAPYSAGPPVVYKCEPEIDEAVPFTTCGSSGKVCYLAGANSALSAADNRIIIGAVPVAELQRVNGQIFSATAGLDGWGNKLAYVVTKSMTDPTPGVFKNNNGAIGAIDEFGQPTAGIKNDAHYALISNGPDGKGAYSREGQLVAPCDLSALDYDNCNGFHSNGIFRQGLFSQGTGPSHYDDIAHFGKNLASDLWMSIPDWNGQMTDIRNMNTNNVGVNTDTPGVALDVTPKAPNPTSAIRADNNTLLKEICTKDGSKCFRADAITGSGGLINCPPVAGVPQIMTGIRSFWDTSLTPPDWNTAATCAPMAFSPISTVTCPAGTWVHGIRSDGKIACINTGTGVITWVP